MTPREIVLAQIRHRETTPVPFTLGFEGDVADRLDAHYGGKSWRDRLTPYIVRCGGIPTMDKEPLSGTGVPPVLHGRDAHATYGRDKFGTLWRLDLRPFHLEVPAMQQPSFDGYAFPTADVFLAPGLKETVEQAKREHPGSFTLVNVPWGLWEHCWAIRGFENALMDCIAEPDFFEELLDRLTNLFLAHVAQCAAVPTDAIMFGDDWGDQRGVTVGPDRWRKFFKPRYAKIYDAVRAQGKLIISHCCGSVCDIMPDIIEIGLNVLESCQPEARGMNPYELKKRWGDKITFWGCLGSQSTIPFGTPADIRGEVRHLCKEMGRGGGFILAPAKSLQPETPTENAAAVVEAFTRQD